MQLKEQWSGPLVFEKQSFLNVSASKIAGLDFWEFATEEFSGWLQAPEICNRWKERRILFILLFQIHSLSALEGKTNKKDQKAPNNQNKQKWQKPHMYFI